MDRGRKTEEVIRDILLRSFQQDSTAPIVEFKIRSNRFRFKFSKSLLNNKLLNYPSIYQSLKSKDILIKKDDSIMVRPECIQRCAMDYDEEGYIKNMSFEMKLSNGNKIVNVAL